ncbi:MULTISPECIES: coenzyme F420-0:L-glutamate ligase [Methanosarcina]|uniref:Coenzyme F420:L-glutamate ligase n=3 Tax=Methanosarcina barkeri TaxID=2208 RepID=A0A0E3QRK6_METBA|nr:MULTISPECIES: coenzyme F420-0:L-glutamate ligase [Methanosarcina]AKB53138.1 Coenzyme F420:L-glutamate ligase [Methanosarcina barkeri MS]AKB58756.1 Coenzyme F420:L-glutamate ligase [Methanosarcina barkeri 227]AKJ39566.1 F420-0:gamma-glutamyl ligase CofE2 [Methanosarcina barkeri CM1]OEC93896.1 coenzyme F420-0:L-glutamate ligase [Methanosarcina sp. A14]
MKFEAIAVENIPLIHTGDNLPSIICKNLELQDRDIVIVASTVVAKAEGEIFRLEDITPGKIALEMASRNGKDARFIQAVLSRSREVLVEKPFMLVTTLAGHTCVNAGVDESNIEDGFLLYPPVNPDASASRLGQELEKLSGKKLSVIVTDTNGRAFKIGQTGAAIGIYKIKPVKHWIGEKDLFGKVLEVTEEAVADELAGAANLLMGEGAGGTPVVVIRGFDYYCGEKTFIKEMYRPEEMDVIKKGLRCLQKKLNKKLN